MLNINDNDCFVIAEAGVNHNGSFELAKKLIDAAVEAGADAVKFQTFKAEELVTEDAEMAGYQKNNTGKKQSQLKMLKELELSYKDFEALKKYCDKKGILFLSSPHTSDAVDFLDKLVPAFKIGSGDITNIPFLKKIAEKGKPVILSTGMSYMHEVKDAISALQGCEIILLHCTSSYPCPREDVNLKAMETLAKETGLQVGYSDHTLGIDVSLMAAKRGAVIIEKHFTIDNSMKGPDHKASLNPKQLKELIVRIKSKNYPNDEEIVLGSSEKKPTVQEIENAKVARKSVVALRDISKGETLSDINIGIKRPGLGLAPRFYYDIIGKKSTGKIKKDSYVKWNNLRKSDTK